MKTSIVVRNTFLCAIFLAVVFVVFVSVAYFLSMLDGTQQYLLEFIIENWQMAFYVWFMMCVSFFWGHVIADKSRNDQE